MRQACIGRSVILNYQVCRDTTSGGCYIPTHCPRLPANVTATLSLLIGRMGGRRGGVCVRVEGQADACGWAHLSPVPARLSPTTSPPPSPLRAAATHGGLSGAGARAGGRAARCMAALAGRRRSTAHEDDADAVLRTVPRCN